ncbi:MAG: TrkH family potassium uptake protein [Gammaproteobacteria bacterium]
MHARFVKYVGSVAEYPAHTLFAWYLGLVAVGAILLSLPPCRAAGADPLSLMDALFTATSAASVTGLMVISTESQLSFVGQVVVLLLIQFGGLGIMTIGTLLFVSFTGRQPVRFHVLTKDTLGAPLSTDVQRLILVVLAITLLLEAIGALILLLARLGDGPFAEVLWWAVFHAVSGFCNAGISLQDASLSAWAGDPAVILTITALIIAGGLGFPVLLDLVQIRRKGMDRRTLRLHTSLVLTATAILLVGGALAVWLLEHDHALGAMPAGQAAMNAFFQSATARSAGFSTMPVESLAYPSLSILLLLMFIGGNSGSTAGGVKVSTFTVLILEGAAMARHRWQTAAFGRRVPERTLRTAATIVAVYIVVLITGIMLLLVLETHGQPHAEASGRFMDITFEGVSALGTVGLSTGITAELSQASQGVIVVMMLLGRVGPLAMASTLLRHPAGPKIRFPQSEVIIG